jgi:hypothetical protein
MVPERDADELSAEQLDRARQEEQLARAAPEAEEVAQHARRAEKARYLREQLERRRDSEREE